MLNKCQDFKKRQKELEELLADHAVVSDTNLCRIYGQELAEIAPIVRTFDELVDVERQIVELTHILKDISHGEEFLALAREELEKLGKRDESLKEELVRFLKPKDLDETRRSVMLEIRAGTGGQEASLFAGDLYRMYTKYAASKNWKVEVMSINETDLGGVKEVVFNITGLGAYKKLKHESGIHRVQRVPQTEASGRIHTSAASVAVLFEPEETELQIDAKDLKVDVYRSSGHGGQSVNTTDSAVRMTHLPTGIVVTCQDERSQIKNKYKAMRVLRTRILDKMNAQRIGAQSELRKSQVGSGDRSEKIRTYNFPDRRVTDHRINLTVHRLEAILDGFLDEVVDALAEEAQKHHE